MSDQLFPAWADTVFRVVLGGGALVTGLGVAGLFAWERSPMITQEDQRRPQPVKFDHRHHVRDDGIACLYCHSDAATGRFAGVPDAETCMGCHNQIWTTSPELAPVRAAVAENKPLVWNRVTNLPDHVFFNHGVHVARGIDCAHCHGDVAAMGQVYAVKPLDMEFCIDCHRERNATTDCSSCHR